MSSASASSSSPDRRIPIIGETGSSAQDLSEHFVILQQKARDIKSAIEQQILLAEKNIRFFNRVIRDATEPMKSPAVQAKQLELKKTTEEKLGLELKRLESFSTLQENQRGLEQMIAKMQGIVSNLQISSSPNSDSSA